MKMQWIALRIMQEILRDRRTLAMFFLMPVVVMTLIYFALVSEEQGRLGVVTRGMARFYEYPLISALQEEQGVEIIPLDLPDEEADPAVIIPKIEEAILSGKVDAVLYFDARLFEERFAGQRGKLHLYLEGSRPTVTAEIFSAISSSLDDLGEDLPIVVDTTCSAACAESFNNKAIELEKHYLHGSDDLEAMDYFLPVLPPFITFFLTFLISAITFQRERARGTLERLLIAPINFAEVVLGYLMGFFLFASTQALIVVTYILALMKNPLTPAQIGSLALVILLVTMFALILGLTLSFLAANEFQTVQFIPIVILPSVFLSDMIWRIERFPDFFRWLSYAHPLTHANQIVRGVLVKDQPLGHYWPQLLLLVGFFLLVLGMMSLVVKRRRKDY